MLNRTFLIFCSFFLLQSNLTAQSKDFDVFQLRFLYNEIKFDKVVSLGQKILKEKDSINKNNLMETHKYLALSFFNLSKQDSSRSHFYSLLSISPEFEPDPVKTSPKILSFFHDIKNSFKKDTDNKIALGYDNYIFVEDIRPQAGLRSFAFPGWGQLYKEQNSKAYIFGAAFLGTLLGTAVTYSIEQDLRDSYLNETNSGKVDDRYSDYNNMSKTRKVLQYTAIGIWATSLTDALFSEYTPKIETNENYLGLSFQIDF